MILLLMGVCGSGKTTIGMKLSELLKWPFLDADDFHSESNKVKMSNDIPLTDEDRYPWLMLLHKEILNWKNNNINGVMVCSALKKKYRYILLHGSMKNLDDSSIYDICSNYYQSENQHHINNLDKNNTTEKSIDNEALRIYNQNYINLEVKLIFLNGDENIIKKRLTRRSNHFMSVSMLKSQLSILEPPTDVEHFFEIDIAFNLDQIILIICKHFNLII